ncbi:hypothetical protein H5410_011247 [Solanum commersonii]|uniref:RING-type domain-containing protein n=1 Tax=Solanum commersonii TaxID=4109 RepID=A0A9J6AN23_SOLCO|nr:hypothetical protein H5410_011247 [Solanum commersonii]
MLDFFYPYPRPVSGAVAVTVPTYCELSLATTTFADVCQSNVGERGVEDSCSICLMEYERENAVCELPRCKHVFHVECIEGWVERLNLPASRFLDLDMSSSCIDETCSICLVEFEKEHVVCQLPRCNHVFHMDCIEKWLERCQFTCPLCRSLLIHRTTPSPCKRS